MVDLNSGKITPVAPCHPPGAQWQSCPGVKAPRGPFKIVAQDNSATGWFAFKAPHELGRLSLWAIQWLKSGKYLLSAGLALFLFNLATLCARNWRRDRPPAPATPG